MADETRNSDSIRDTHLSADSADSSKRLLVAAAKKLFALKGFESTTVRELAEEAGVNPALINYHFETKEGLYRTVIAQFGKEKLAAAQRLLQGPNNLEEFRVRLQMFMEELFQSHLLEPDLTKVVHRECDMASPLTSDIFRNTFMKVFETLVEFIKASQKKGILKKDLDPLITTHIFFSSMMHILKTDEMSRTYFNQTIRDETYRQKLTDHILRLFLEGTQK